jgi:hypothetical protein
MFRTLDHDRFGRHHHRFNGENKPSAQGFPWVLPGRRDPRAKAEKSRIMLRLRQQQSNKDKKTPPK